MGSSDMVEAATADAILQFQSISVSPTPDSVTVTLPGVLDLALASALHEALSEAMSHKLPIHVHSDAVDRCSTACVQVIVAAGRAMKAGGIPGVLVKPAPSFVDAFDDLGLFAELANWEVQA